MTWKRWDEDVWVNMNCVAGLKIKFYPDPDFGDNYSVFAYINAHEDAESDLYYIKEFETREEAVAFVKELMR